VSAEAPFTPVSTSNAIRIVATSSAAAITGSGLTSVVPRWTLVSSFTSATAANLALYVPNDAPVGIFRVEIEIVKTANSARVGSAVTINGDGNVVILFK
jgi:hypothetical protein